MNTMQKMLFRPNLVMDNAAPAAAAPVGLTMACGPGALPLRDALRVKSAEFWLLLGWAELASRELEGVSTAACGHPWTRRVQLLVWSALTLE